MPAPTECGLRPGQPAFLDLPPNRLSVLPNTFSRKQDLLSKNKTSKNSFSEHRSLTTRHTRNSAIMIQDEHGCIDYDESGDGPTIVLVPGSCSTGAAWRPIVSQWENGFRCVTTSLLGYGRTTERRSAHDADISHEAEMLEAVIRRAAGPVHLVGHSFGGLVALAVALRKQVPLLSLTIAEAPAPEILRHTGEQQHHRAFREMSDAYFAAFRAGQSAAIERMIDFYGGAGTFAGWPRRVRDYAVETTPVNILDWASAFGFALTPALLASVETPTLVLWGGASHPAIVRANQLLGEYIPRATVATIDGAAHFMIASHAKVVAGMIAEHVRAWDAKAVRAADRSSQTRYTA
jgi:pimeloyl-ACP methyl ester carboxylesterase